MGSWGNFSIEESNGRPGAHRLGDQEREDLNEVATVATWEIAPFHSSDGWSLTIIVEDEVGPRAVEDEINLKTFYKEFIRPGRGGANVIAEAADPTTKRARLVSSPGSRQTATVTAARKAE